MWKWCELMRMMLPPLRPISSDLGLPTQVQDFLNLLPNLVLTLLQSCLSLECTVTPKLNLRLIARRFRGFHHAAWRWCWRLPRSSAGTGSWWHSNGPTSSVRGLSGYRCPLGTSPLLTGICLALGVKGPVTMAGFCASGATEDDD